MASRLTRWAAAAAAALLAAGGLALATPAQAAPAKSEHQRIVDFWTVDKVKQAKPRDFVYDEATGKFKLNAKPVGQGGPSKPSGSGVLGADWTGGGLDGGLVQKTTGKVLFAMAGGLYVCSGSVAVDGNDTTSVILTAGHCVYDNAAVGAYATMWMFVPDYDATPTVGLDGDGRFCDNTKYGCWTAQALVASGHFTNETSFSTEATLHDYAFATVGAGGKAKSQLDAVVGAQPIQFTKGTSNGTTELFGYPAAKPYDGKRLIYSENKLGLDTRNANQTYRVASNMTGGCSGGPWFQGFSGGAGTMMSVNSYGYGGRDLYMQGPILNDETKGMYNRAQTPGATGEITFTG